MNVKAFANSENFPQEFESHRILSAKMIKDFIDKIFLLGTEDVREDFAVVISDDLPIKYEYVIGEGKGVVIEIGEKNAFTYVFEAIGDHGEVEKVLVFERHHGNQLRLEAHEVAVLRWGGTEVGVVYISGCKNIRGLLTRT